MKNWLLATTAIMLSAVSFAQAPPNDNACQAIALTPANTCTYVQGTNVNATNSTGMAVPACANYSGGDVWYKATVPAGGAVTFDMQAGTMTDAGMAVYRGNTCVALVLIACDDNSSSNANMPKITVTGLNPGSTVYARVWAKNNINNGTFGICATIPAPAPPNDEPCTGTELIPTATCTYQTFTTESASNSTGVPAPVCAGFLGGDVWFKVVVPAGTTALIFDTQQGAMTDGGMAIYSGPNCNTLTFVDCDDNSSTNTNMPKLTIGGLTPGDTIWARVWSKNNVGTGTFGICVTLPPPGPSNDEPCNAIELTAGATCTYQNFTNQDATGTTTVPDPPCAGYSGADVWFKVVVPAGGALTIDTQEGVMLDGGMAAYRGTCNGLFLLNCDDNSSTNGAMPKLTLGGLTPGDTVWIRMWENGNNNNGTFGICVSIPPPAPANDDPCNATELIGGNDCTYQTFTNENATGTVGPPAPGCASYSGGDVWFRTIVPASGGIIIDSRQGVITDGGMAAYSGTCNNLTLIECDDDDSQNGNMPFLSLTGLNPGDTIWIRFWEFGGDGNGTFDICVRNLPPPPANDDPCNAIVIPVEATCTYQTFTNENASATTGAPAPGCANFLGADVWFAVVVPAGGAISFDSQTGVMTDGGMAVYSGHCDNLTLLSCDDNASANGNMPRIVVAGQTPGDTLWVRMWENGNNNNGTFGLCASLPPPPPANDDPCGAIELTAEATCTYSTFTNDNATGTLGVPAPGCAGYSGGDVWFKVVVPAGGALSFDTQTGVITDGGMAVYKGTCNNLTLINCDDNSSANGAMPKLVIGGQNPGDTLWVRFWENGNDNNGTFGICVSIPPPPPANDEPCNAIELIASTTCTYQVFTNENATATPGVTAPGCANYQGGDVWFKVVVPADGALVFDTEDQVITDGGMAIYRGSCNNLTLIECDDDDSNNGLMPMITAGGLTPGDTIWIRFWEYGGDNNGTFGICVKIPPPPPANDNPCSAIELTPSATCTYQTFTNENATGNTGIPAPGCAGYSGSDVWFKVVVPAGGALVFDSQEGAMTDGGMAIYKGSCTSLSLLACDDNSSANGFMPMITAGGLTPGDTIWVRFWENGNNNNGTFGICVTIPPPGPANDDPCNAISLTPSATCAYQTFDNTGAINTVGIPAPGCANYQGGDIWFKVVVPAEGGIIIDTQEGTMTDGGMALYTGSCSGGLTLVDCDDNNSVNGNMPTIYATGLVPGTTVWIRMWSNGNANNGSFGICVTVPPPQPATFSFSCPKDTTINCDNCFSLTTVIPNIHASTDEYVVNPLSGPGNCFRPYVGPQEIGPSTNLGNDDVYTGVINLPFTFPFYGTDYSALVASTNGYLSFDQSRSGLFSHWQILQQNGAFAFGTSTTADPIDVPSALLDKALIMGPYHDIDPALSTSVDMQIKYNVTGIAPNRRWVLSFYKVPLYSCTNSINNTHQIVLYEGSGMVEVFVFDKQICNGWNRGRAMIGMQDFTRTKAIMAPGRKASDAPWGSIGMNESWRFTPAAGPTLFKRVELYDTSGHLMAVGDTSTIDIANFKVTFPSVCPAIQTLGVTTYIVKSVYQQYNNPAGEITATDTIRVNRNKALNALYTITNAACNGAPTGSIVVAAAGSRPYEYSSNGGATYQSDSSFLNLAPGNYRMVVKDANNCTRDTTITIRPGDPLTGLYVITPAPCNGGNGTVVVSPTTGTAPYTYSADGGLTTQTTNTFTLPAGTYAMRFVDINSCSMDTTITITEPEIIVPGITTTAATCSGAATGKIKVTQTGGTAPYQYSIDNGTTYQSADSFLVVAGTYTIRIKDANNCTKDTTITVTEPAPIMSTGTTTPALCNAGTDGTIVITPVGGTSPYEYSIDNGVTYQVGNSFTVAAGSYTIRIKDLNGCTHDTTLNVTEPAPIATPAVVADATCAGNNGSITVNPAGGASPYTYSIDNGATYQNSNVFSVPAGTYTIRVKDSNGCTKDTTIIVAAVSAILSPSVITPVPCFGANNGTIVLSPAGGTGPYEYSIDNGTSYQTSNSFSVAAGSYTIRVKDANGCTKDTTVIVTQPEPIVSPSVLTPASCHGASTGSIVMNPAGGTGAYQYSIDNGSTYQASNTFTVAAGTYTIRVKDANGCTKDTTVTITEPSAIITPTVITAAKCNGSADGVIVINAAGGTGSYQYSIDNGVTYQAGNSFTVAAGSHTIRVKDANGCTKDTTVEVTQPSVLAVELTTANATCTPGPSGQITVNASGATPSYTYSIDNGSSFQTGNTFAVAAGPYTITVKDANGCVQTATASVGTTFDLYVNGRLDTVICDNGRIRLNTSSNATSFSWTPTNTLDDPSIASPFASPNSTTDYILTATLGDCTIKDTVTIVVTPAPTVFAGNDVTVVKGEDAQLVATISSNVASFAWSPVTYLNNPTSLSPISVMPQETTTYTLTVTNAEGCSRTDDVKVIVLPYCIKVKNAFTPNGDGVNDNWMVYDQFDCLTNVKVQVFNRYGSRVYQSTNYRNDWKGTYAGSSLPDGTYYYVIDFTLTSGRVLQVRGDVTILR